MISGSDAIIKGLGDLLANILAFGIHGKVEVKLKVNFLKMY